MIHSLIHPGSGLGNQLFRLVAGKVVAADKFDDYSAIGRENFKGKDFMNIDFGRENDIKYHVEMPAGKIVIDDPLDSFSGHIIDDEFQSPTFWEHRLGEIDDWLKAVPLTFPKNKCAIGFRGGEFTIFPELFLTQEYWDEAIGTMKKLRPFSSFEVHTDDPETASKFFPYECTHDIGLNWRTMRNAKYAIIANSSFYILPRLLKHFEDPEAVTIAPRYWARHNTKEWSMPQNYYKCFMYL